MYILYVQSIPLHSIYVYTHIRYLFYFCMPTFLISLCWIHKRVQAEKAEVGRVPAKPALSGVPGGSMIENLLEICHLVVMSFEQG